MNRMYTPALGDCVRLTSDEPPDRVKYEWLCDTPLEQLTVLRGALRDAFEVLKDTCGAEFMAVNEAFGKSMCTEEDRKTDLRAVEEGINQLDALQKHLGAGKWMDE